MSRKIHLCGCHLGFKKFQIPCQTPNYQILLIYDIYNLNISRFQPLDMLVLIADITAVALRTGIDDITGFLAFNFSSFVGDITAFGIKRDSTRCRK